MALFSNINAWVLYLNFKVTVIYFDFLENFHNVFDFLNKKFLKLKVRIKKIK